MGDRVPRFKRWHWCSTYFVLLSLLEFLGDLWNVIAINIVNITSVLHTTGHQCRIAEKLPLTQYPLRHIHRASKNAQALSRLSSGEDQRSVSHILRALPTFLFPFASVSGTQCTAAAAEALFYYLTQYINFTAFHCFFLSSHISLPLSVSVS